MTHKQVGSGWQADSGHGPEGAPCPARGLVRRTACMGSALALLILLLSKEAAL